MSRIFEGPVAARDAAGPPRDWQAFLSADTSVPGAEVYFWESETQEFFFMDSPGLWRRRFEAPHRYVWHHWGSGEEFVEPAGVLSVAMYLIEARAFQVRLALVEAEMGQPMPHLMMPSYSEFVALRRGLTDDGDRWERSSDTSAGDASDADSDTDSIDSLAVSIGRGALFG